MKIRLIKRKKEVDFVQLWEAFVLIGVFVANHFLKSTPINIWLLVIFIFYCFRYYAGKYELEVLK